MAHAAMPTPRLDHLVWRGPCGAGAAGRRAAGVAWRSPPATRLGSACRAWDTPGMVDSEPGVKSLIDTLKALPVKKLYLDFEGINLSRNGKLSIAQLTWPGAQQVYLLDFVVLPGVLEVAGSGGTTLRSILEDPSWTKFIFDPRNDVDCLYNTCGKVYPRNVICLQLCEVAHDRMRGRSRRLVNGLKSVLEAHVPKHLSAGLSAIKAKGRALFAPELGGSYTVFEQRPLAPEIWAYCRADVEHFKTLEDKLYAPLTAKWVKWVKLQSDERVACCLDAQYDATSKKRVLAPK